MNETKHGTTNANARTKLETALETITGRKPQAAGPKLLAEAAEAADPSAGQLAWLGQLGLAYPLGCSLCRGYESKSIVAQPRPAEPSLQLPPWRHNAARRTCHWQGDESRPAPTPFPLHYFLFPSACLARPGAAPLRVPCCRRPPPSWLRWCRHWLPHRLHETMRSSWRRRAA